MEKLNLQKLNLQKIERIMDELGAVPRIFNSEAQFQFELAWKIKEEFDREVKLEPLSRNYTVQRVRNGCTKPYTKNDYTDIILEKDGLKIALELKYKTAIIDGYTLKNQGAADLGAYDFMWDVHRLQILTKREPEKAAAQPAKIFEECEKGYVIILTNDSHYWKDKAPKNTINREFLIGGDNSGKGKLDAGTHEWWDKEGNRGNLPPAIQNYSSRQDSIKMSKDYNYQWKQYCDLKATNGVFKYMIVEIS